MTQFLIIKETVCPECNGTRYITNEIYIELAEFTKSIPNRHQLSFEEIDKKQEEWMEKHGYQPNNWPVEEWPCECTETLHPGKAREEVTLQDAIKELEIIPIYEGR